MKHRGKAYYQGLEKLGGNDACVLLHTALRKTCDSPATSALCAGRGCYAEDAGGWVRDIFRKAGRPEPSDADFEDKMLECEVLEIGR